MSQAPAGIVEQAQRLAASARMLPVDDAVKVLEQAVTVLQAAQAQVLVEGERSGELAAASGCRTVRSFAMSILRRSAGDASGLAGVAVHLVAFPKLAKAYAAGRVHTPNLRTIIRHLPACGLGVLQEHEDALLELATQAGPAEVGVFCQALAEVHRPDDDEAKVRAAGLRSVRITAVGDLAHLDAMLDPALAARLKASLAATARATRAPDDGRTHGERSADALENLLRAGMDHIDVPAKQDARRARATVTVALETLLGMPGHGQGLLARFGLIPTGTAQHLACDALVSLVLTHGNRVLNVGRTRRTVTRRQRTALAATHDRCAMPGCQVPFANCDIHHLWWWHLAGLPTSTSKSRSAGPTTVDCTTATTASPATTAPWSSATPTAAPSPTPDRSSPNSSTSSPPPRPRGVTYRPTPTTTAPGAGPANPPNPHQATAHPVPDALIRRNPGAGSLNQ
ncbi:MAG TPA: DUF222 domain-containing protein [Nocardioidaceae bacterium]|nr:DUF222 domain-containing protein [Nocardioidaceae bacterium]